MVESLIEATANTIARRGLDGTTTPLIAETAGVSVGSLYQYFDDKEALIAALMDKLASDLSQRLNQQIPLSEQADLAHVVKASIQLAVAFMHSNEGLYLELARNWHRLPMERIANALEQHILHTGRLYFLKHYRDYPIKDLQVKLFISFNSILFTMVRLSGQENALLEENAVIDGLAHMVTQYLLGDSPNA